MEKKIDYASLSLSEKDAYINRIIPWRTACDQFINQIDAMITHTQRQRGFLIKQENNDPNCAFALSVIDEDINPRLYQIKKSFTTLMLEYNEIAHQLGVDVK